MVKCTATIFLVRKIFISFGIIAFKTKFGNVCKTDTSISGYAFPFDIIVCSRIVFEISILINDAQLCDLF